METGTFTRQPVRTSFGYHVIKALGDLQPAHEKPVSQATRDEVPLADAARTERANAWFDEVEREYAALTCYRPGYRPRRAA